LLPPAIVGDVAKSLDRWSKLLREAVEAGEITVEEASKAWSQYEYQDE
jgi:polyhydroxyalkanoate synthesis regulator phasin